MKFIRQYWVIGSLSLILLLYIATRLYNLTLLPIFTDEAIYIRWSQIAKNDAMWRFISLTDGKQPMYVWIAMILLKFFHDPLTAGRLVSVFSGLFSTIGIFFLARELFKNTKIGLLSSFIYVIFPFALTYDRMALYDSLVSMFVIWAYYFTLLLVRTRRLDIGMILGMIIGGGLLTKSNTAFSLILLPFSLLLFPFQNKHSKKMLAKWILFALVAFGISVIMYSVLRLSPFYHIIGEKNLTFIYSFSDWIKNPFAYVFGNLKGLIDWFVTYTTIPFILLAVCAFLIKKKDTKEKLLLLVWFIVPFFALAFFGKVIYPRFILFMTMPVLILGSYALYHFMQISKKLLIQVLIILAFVGFFLVNDYLILTNPNNAFLPQADKEQFLVGWPAGGGVKESIQYFESQAKNGPILIATEGTFGLMPYALEMYLQNNPSIKITSFWPVSDLPPAELIASAKKIPTYVVFYQPCPACSGIGKAPLGWKGTLVYQFKKTTEASYSVYKLDPQ